MAKMTKAFLEAKCAALTVENDDLKATNVALQRQLSLLQSSNINQVRDRTSIVTQRELMTQCRDLNARGVPCLVRGGMLIHAKTRAPITYYPET